MNLPSKSNLKLPLDDVSNVRKLVYSFFSLVVDYFCVSLSFVEVEDGLGLPLIQLHSVFDDALLVVLSLYQLYVALIAFGDVLFGQEWLHFVAVIGINICQVVVFIAGRAHSSACQFLNQNLFSVEEVQEEVHSTYLLQLLCLVDGPGDAVKYNSPLLCVLRVSVNFLYHINYGFIINQLARLENVFYFLNERIALSDFLLDDLPEVLSHREGFEVELLFDELGVGPFANSRCPIHEQVVLLLLRGRGKAPCL